MAVFISHSFHNKPEFDNIVDALTLAEVPYWNPAEVKPGSSLRDQLRQAVEQCSLCIFVATHRSLESSWCGAELGAFWGAGKPVIVYLADSSLADEELPPIVQGDVWERRISKVAARAKELLIQWGESSTTGGSNIGSTRVGNMTIDQLEGVLRGTLSLAATQGKSEGRDANLLRQVISGLKIAVDQAARKGSSFFSILNSGDPINKLREAYGWKMWSDNYFGWLGYYLVMEHPDVNEGRKIFVGRIMEMEALKCKLPDTWREEVAKMTTHGPIVVLDYTYFALLVDDQALVGGEVYKSGGRILDFYAPLGDWAKALDSVLRS